MKLVLIALTIASILALIPIIGNAALFVFDFVWPWLLTFDLPVVAENSLFVEWKPQYNQRWRLVLTSLLPSFGTLLQFAINALHFVLQRHHLKVVPEVDPAINV